MHGKRGITLVEISIALVLTSILGTSVLLLVSSGTQAMKVAATVTLVNSSAREGLDEISAHLLGADLNSILPAGVAAPGSTSSIDFQRITGFEAGAVVRSNTERISLQPHPTDPSDGLDNNGNGLVDECQVIWTENLGRADERRSLLVNWVQPSLAGETDGNGLDDNGNGLVDEAGLCFDYDGRRLYVHLSLERPSAGLEAAAVSTVRKIIVLNAYDL